MKLAKYIFRSAVPFSLDFNDSFYHDRARVCEREEVYIKPAFCLQPRIQSPRIASFCADFRARSLPSYLAQMSGAKRTASAISRLAGENFNAYLKSAPPSDQLDGALDDTLENCRALLAKLGALEAFERAHDKSIATPKSPHALVSAAAPFMPISLKILEIGFGFALNFLLAYRRAKEQNRRIYYAAIESHYVDAAAIKEHAQSLNIALPEGFLAAYPPRAHGVYRIDLAHARLDLYFGDAREILPRLQPSFDAVFYDVFARQNDLNAALLPHCARLCSGKIFSFLANSAFKRELKAAGFSLFFRPAAHKREVCASSAPALPRAHLGARSVVIIGAGIAGLLAAKELQSCGVRVVLLDESGVASKGSGNILGQISHACHSDASALGQLQYLGAIAASRALGVLAPHMCERAASEQAAAIMARCNYPLARKCPGGRMLLASGTISPKFYCEKLASLFKIHRERLVRAESDENSARAICASGAVYEADALIIAAGCGCIGAINAPLSAVRGQVCWIASEQTRGVSERAYITAANGGVAVLGATFERVNNSAIIGADGADDADDADDADGAGELPGLRLSEAHELLRAANLSEANLLAIKSGWRCYSGDRFALIGNLRMADEISAAQVADAATLSRVFISAAHGSRGLSSAILAARMLAEQIIGANSGVYADLAAQCDPNRFVRRQKKKSLN